MRCTYSFISNRTQNCFSSSYISRFQFWMNHFVSPRLKFISFFRFYQILFDFWVVTQFVKDYPSINFQRSTKEVKSNFHDSRKLFVEQIIIQYFNIFNFWRLTSQGICVARSPIRFFESKWMCTPAWIPKSHNWSTLFKIIFHVMSFLLINKKQLQPELLLWDDIS